MLFIIVYDKTSKFSRKNNDIYYFFVIKFLIIITIVIDRINYFFLCTIKGVFIMKSKFFLFVVYIGVIWLVGIFIFGKSGVIDNMNQSKEAMHLTEVLWQSKEELENMTREYYRLSEMKEPTQAFLVEQGRKTEDIIVFKRNTKTDSSEQEKKSITKEQLLFFQSVGVALIILFLGLLGIYMIAHLNNKKKFKELSMKYEEGEEG